MLKQMPELDLERDTLAVSVEETEKEITFFDKLMKSTLDKARKNNAATTPVPEAEQEETPARNDSVGDKENRHPEDALAALVAVAHKESERLAKGVLL